jgi:uncharacterized membrane protein
MNELEDYEPDRNEEKQTPAILQKLIQNIEKENPELLRNIPNKEEVVSGIITTMIEIKHKEEHHSGPLPHPKILKKYDKIIPNGAERIVKVFEKQSDHRISLEKRVVWSQTFQSVMGQIMGFIIAIVFLIAGFYLVINGHEAAGITIFGLDIVGLVAVFVVGKYQQKKSLNDNE